MNYELKPFKPSDLIGIEMREHERETLNLDNFFAMAMSPMSHCATMFDIQNNILAIVGLCELWDGVLQVFVLPSIHVSRCGVGFVRAIKRLLDSIQESHKPHRMQTWSLDDDQTNNWMKALGFTCEGKMLYFTNNKHDYCMWARYGNGR